MKKNKAVFLLKYQGFSSVQLLIVVAAVLFIVLAGSAFIIDDKSAAGIGKSDQAQPDTKVVQADTVLTQKARKTAESLPVKNPEVILKLHGSNTIGAALVPGLVKKYLLSLGAFATVDVPSVKENERSIQAYLPASDQVVAVEIQAHGSSTAFNGLRQKQADIGMSSRPIKQKEMLDLIIATVE